MDGMMWDVLDKSLIEVSPHPHIAPHVAVGCDNTICNYANGSYKTIQTSRQLAARTSVSRTTVSSDNCKVNILLW